MLNRGSYLDRACANLSRLSQNETCSSKDGWGGGGRRRGGACVAGKKDVMFNHVL